MPDAESPTRVAFAATGVANLASIMAAFRRAGVEPSLASSPEDLALAPFAVVPGVGSFGSAVSALRKAGMDEAIRDRITRGVPTAGVCAGMQIFFEASEESPGVAGLGLVGGAFGRFPSSLPVPQLGWNFVKAPSLDPDEGALTAELRSARLRDSPGIVKNGWAYFANSYRLSSAPAGFAASSAVYGESFVAAAERPGLLLCQFHPELSGPWGLELLKRWLAAGAETASGAPRSAASEGRKA
jgi:imidazole glycerol-phosphate synthase subunit HisH